MQKITIIAPLFTVEIEGEDARDIIEAAAFWQSLPKKCPLCGSPLILDYTTPKTFKYYKLKCIGTPAHSVNFGQRKGTLALYYDATKPWDVFRPGHADELTDRTTPEAASPAAADPAAAQDAQNKNALIKLIADCKAAGIRSGLTVGDVGKMDAQELVNQTERLRRIYIKKQ